MPLASTTPQLRRCSQCAEELDDQGRHVDPYSEQDAELRQQFPETYRRRRVGDSQSFFWKDGDDAADGKPHMMMFPLNRCQAGAHAYILDGEEDVDDLLEDDDETEPEALSPEELASYVEAVADRELATISKQ